MASCSFTSACAAIASGAEWSSIRAARSSLERTSWERCGSTRAPPNTASACISRSRCLQRGFGSCRGRMWSRSCVAPEFVEECKTSSKGARSGRPASASNSLPGFKRGWRRTTRRGLVWFHSAGRRKSTRKMKAGSGQGCHCSTASSTRPRSASCSFGGDGEGSPRRAGRTTISPDCFSTRNHWAQDQRGAERLDGARREKKSSVKRTNHIDGGQQGQLSKLLFCFEDARVDGEHGGLRLPVARRITTWGLQGVRVGEASHPGPLRRHMSRPIEGRERPPGCSGTEPFRWTMTVIPHIPTRKSSRFGRYNYPGGGGGGSRVTMSRLCKAAGSRFCQSMIMRATRNR